MYIATIMPFLPPDVIALLILIPLKTNVGCRDKRSETVPVSSIALHALP